MGGRRRKSQHFSSYPKTPRKVGEGRYPNYSGVRRKSAVGHDVLAVIKLTAFAFGIILVTSFVFNKDWKILLLAIFFFMVAWGKWSLAAGFGLFYDSVTDFYLTPQIASFLSQEFGLPQDTAQIVAKMVVMALAMVLLGSMRKVAKFVAGMGGAGFLGR